MLHQHVNFDCNRHCGRDLDNFHFPILDGLTQFSVVRTRPIPSLGIIYAIVVAYQFVFDF